MTEFVCIVHGIDKSPILYKDRQTCKQTMRHRELMVQRLPMLVYVGVPYDDPKQFVEDRCIRRTFDFVDYRNFHFAKQVDPLQVYDSQDIPVYPKRLPGLTSRETLAIWRFIEPVPFTIVAKENPDFLTVILCYEFIISLGETCVAVISDFLRRH